MRRCRRMVMFSCSWVAAAAAYLLFAGQFSPDELVAAATCGLVTALWSMSIRGVARLHFRFEQAALGAVSRGIAGLPNATIRTAGALARVIVVPLHGFVSARPFIRGARQLPLDVGRRAIAVLALSLAPDSFVLRAPQDREEIDMHNLTEAPLRGDARWPI